MRRWIRSLSAFVGTLSYLHLSTLVSADVIFVRAAASGANDGTSWANAFADLQLALAAAEPGDEIWIAAGEYKPAGPLDPTVSFELPGHVALYGGFSGNEASLEQRDPSTNLTILTGLRDFRRPRSHHVLRADANTVDTLLDGLQIIEGFANAGSADRTGGGLLMVGGSLTFRNCRITTNRAGPGGASPDGGDGGAVHATGGAQLTFEQCYFGGNSAGAGSAGNTGTPRDGGNGGRGGAIFAENATLVFAYCGFGSNLAGNGGPGGLNHAAGAGGSGGAIYARNVSISISNCGFFANETGAAACDGNSPSVQSLGGRGGAAYIDSVETALDLSGCNFSYNVCGDGRAAHGGGLYLTGIPSVNFVDCRFEANRAGRGDPVGGDGGALFADGVAVSALRCTFDRNGAGGGREACQSQTLHGGNGGAILISSASLALAECDFTDNGSGAPTVPDGYRGSGGAIMLGRGPFDPPGEPAAISLRACRFERNQSATFAFGGLGGHGGALCAQQATTVDISDCVFSENAALGDGGAVQISQATDITIKNCLMAANESGVNSLTGTGGALAAAAAQLTMTNVTVVGNSATSPLGGGGISIGGAAAVRNTVLWQNTAGGGSLETQQLLGFDSDDSIEYSRVQGFSGAFGGLANSGADPLFVDLSRGIYHVGNGSSCIDSGNNARLSQDTAFDIAGNPRFVDDPETPDSGAGDAPIVDIGCMEFGPCPGDLDGDRDVDLPELALLLSQFGSTGADLIADLDHDNDVDLADLTVMLTTFGAICP